MVWAGLFLLLAGAGVVISRHLWPGLAGTLFNLGPASLPQAAVLWRASCPPDAGCALGPSGKVLLVTGAAGAGGSGGGGSGGGAAGGGVTTGDAAPQTGLLMAVNGETTAILTEPGQPLAWGFFDPALAEPPDGRVRAGDSWRVVLARAGGGGPAGSGQVGESAGSGEASAPDGFLSEEVLCVEAGGSRVLAFTSGNGVATAACAWVDEANLVLGLYAQNADGNLEGKLIAVGSGREALWTHSVGRAPVHRVAALPGAGFVAAATPTTVGLFDSHGTLLWSRTLKTPIRDLALHGHGGPVVAAGDTLLVYDRRGNLIWRKKARSPLRAVACAGGRIAVAGDDGVAVYDEDGMARWALACPSPPVSLDLDREAKLLAVVLESGTLVVAQAPGAARSEAEGDLPGPAWAGRGRP